MEILASIDLLGESRNTMHLEVFRGQITLWSGDAGDLRARDAVLAVTGGRAAQHPHSAMRTAARVSLAVGLVDNANQPNPSC